MANLGQFICGEATLGDGSAVALQVMGLDHGRDDGIDSGAGEDGVEDDLWEQLWVRRVKLGAEFIGKARVVAKPDDKATAFGNAAGATEGVVRHKEHAGLR
jgi:hypothetical protein